MIKEIAHKIWKLNADSNVYFLEKEKIVIDTGWPQYKSEVQAELSKVTDLKKVKKVIFTHLHYDHIGNFELFPNASFYASKEEISYFKENPSKAVLELSLAKKFAKVKLNVLDKLDGFDILKVPGHTCGSIALFYKKEKILFSGDTLFFNGMGRIDLPNSSPEEMDNSLKRLKKTKYKILAPGHDY